MPLALFARTTSSFGASTPSVVKLQRPAARRLVAVASAAPTTSTDNPVVLTDKAMAQLRRLKDESKGQKEVFRLGVKSGGCSGMSYTMDFATSADITPEDMVFTYDGGFKMVIDPKSLLYLFGLTLDFSDALVGGGFQFKNPNATSSCGCGSSFSV